MPIGNCARRRYPSETVSDDLPIAAQHPAFQHHSRAAGSFFGQSLSLPDARALINEGRRMASSVTAANLPNMTVVVSTAITRYRPAPA